MSIRPMSVDEYFDFKNKEDWLPLNSEGKFDPVHPTGKATADGRWVANGDEFLKMNPALVDPPNDPAELWERKRVFLLADLDASTGVFESVKAKLLKNDWSWRDRLVWRKVYGPRPDDEVELLQALKKHVDGVNDRLAALDASNPNQAQIDAEAARQAEIAAENARYRTQQFERERAILGVNL